MIKWFLALIIIFKSTLLLSAQISDCDKFAGSTYDDNNPYSSNGVEWDDLNPELAIPACEIAFQENPNDPRIIFQLARAYEKSDLEKSISLYEKSADYGYSTAFYNLGLIYYFDIEDLDLSVEYLKKSINAGIEVGYPNYFIALNYWWYDVKYTEAEENLQIAINSGLLSDEDQADAYYKLGWYNQEKGDGREAVSYYTKSLEYNSDDVTTLNSLAFIFSEGVAGVPQDMAKSINYLKRSADLGSSLAANNLGHHYETGLGVEQSFEKAFEYYNKSYEIGTTSLAYNNLAYLYLNGYGVDKDINKVQEILQSLIMTFDKEGYDYFEGANNYIDNAVEDAKQQLDSINDDTQKLTAESEGNWGESDICSYIEENLDKGFNQDQVFQKCLIMAESGDELSMENIAYAYEKGLVVKQNFQKAYDWYSLYGGEWGLYKKLKLLIYGYAIDENFDLIKSLDNLIYNPQNPDFSENYVNEAKFLKALLFRHGIQTNRNFDTANKYLNEILELEDFDQTIISREMVVSLLNEIKSIKSGFQVEIDYTKYFPADFSGSFMWSDIDSENQIVSNIFLDNLIKIGPSRYKIKGKLTHENGVQTELVGFLDSRKNNFSFRQINPVGSEDQNLDNYHINGDYIGYFSNSFEFATAHYLPDNTGSPGYLKFTRNSVNDFDQIEKLNLNFGNYYALVIGNNNYEENMNLDTAVLDAEAVANVLEKKYGFQIIKLIKNGNRKEILSSLNQLKTTLNRGDNLLIYYAGHGYYDETGRGYWLPVDAASLESEDTTQWISSDDIINIMAKISSNHILVVADSCFSGALTTRGSSLSSEDRTNLYKNLIQKKTRKALTSGALEPVLDGGGEGHSIFADSFLRILSDNTQVLDTTSLYNQLYKEVASAADQSPQYGVVQKTGDEGGDFIFVPIY